jgi:hypothetical protein
VEIPRALTPQEVLYVEGLKTNLLSLSQFCDQDLVVQFSKKECNIFYSNEKWLMGSERTTDNCYGLSTYPHVSCNKATIDKKDLWHQRLSYMNYSDLTKAAKKGALIDLPKMDKIEKSFCGACQLGKQIRTLHKKTSGILSSLPLDFERRWPNHPQMGRGGLTTPLATPKNGRREGWLNHPGHFGGGSATPKAIWGVAEPPPVGVGKYFPQSSPST